MELNFKQYSNRLSGRGQSPAACRVCGYTGESPMSFCIMCGTPNLSERRVGEMVYKAIPTTSTGKALVCPHCDNEELNGGDFCMVCGNEVVNHCADVAATEEDGGPLSRSCGNILPGNARYCPRCGNESTFYQKGWLRDWKSENVKKAISNIKVV